MITLTSVDHIDAPAEKVWHFLTHLHEGNNYLRWHPVDHISWTLLSGDPETAGSTYHFAEMLDGKKFATKFRLHKAERLKYLEYHATGLLGILRLATASFELRSVGVKTELIAKVYIGYGWPVIGRLVDWAAHRVVSMRAITNHMNEEGQYLNKALSKEGL